MASAPFQPLHSRVQIQNHVFRGPEGGEGRTGWPEARSGGSGAVAILSSSRNTGLFLPSTLHRLSGSAGHLPSQVSSKPPQSASELERVQARKTTKMMKKTMRMRKILTMSHRLEVTDWKYLRISEWAASTSSWAPDTFSSILGIGSGGEETEGQWIRKNATEVDLLTWKHGHNMWQ